MIHYKSQKNNPGFMLMEVLFTIAIVGIALAPIFILQTNSLQSLRRYSLRLQSIFRANRQLKEKVAVLAESDPSLDKQKIPTPAGVSSETKKVGPNSVFKKIKDIHSVQVNVRSLLGVRESIVGFVYKPEKQEKK